MRVIERERTSPEVILYALYLYFLGLSLRSTSKAIQPFGEEGRKEEVMSRFGNGSRDLTPNVFTIARVSAFLIDEIMLQVDWP